MTDIITDDDIDWENSGNWFGEACDCVEKLRAQLAACKIEVEDLLELLLDAIVQATLDDDELDSMALTSYANAMRFLAERGKIKIKSEYGRRVIATLPEGE